jgi:hypothetical protein
LASEETEENTIYAADDRAAAKEELEKLKQALADIVEPGSDYPAHVREEVNKRVAHRVRELDHAFKALEEKAMHQD